MEVISLHGTEDRLYELVARLVMNPDIIRQNNNYPFKTTPQHIWYICMCDGEVVGFMPVKTTSGGMYIDNYYIRDDRPEVLDALITDILSASDKPVTALCHKDTQMCSAGMNLSHAQYSRSTTGCSMWRKGGGSR